jgi:hypothetical protein
MLIGRSSDFRARQDRLQPIVGQRPDLPALQVLISRNSRTNPSPANASNVIPPTAPVPPLLLLLLLESPPLLEPLLVPESSLLPESPLLLKPLLLLEPFGQNVTV